MIARDQRPPVLPRPVTGVFVLQIIQTADAQGTAVLHQLLVRLNRSARQNQASATRETSRGHPKHESGERKWLHQPLWQGQGSSAKP